jgi:hypothetical protein
LEITFLKQDARDLPFHVVYLDINAPPLRRWRWQGRENICSSCNRTDHPVP